MNTKNTNIFTSVKTTVHTVYLTTRSIPLCIALVFAFMLSVSNAIGQVSSSGKSDDELINQFVLSKGLPSIVFDASNIKQFWVDSSVLSDKNTINVFLTKQSNRFESNPLRIQLANVNESQDCKVDVITEDSDAGFVVTNSASKVLSKSSLSEEFIHYHVFSSVFHLEQAPGFVFNLKLNNTTDKVSIKKIILSFSQNKTGSYRSSPGVLKITSDNTTLQGGATAVPAEEDSFSMTGKNSQAISKIYILPQNNMIKSSVKIKNTGTTQTHVYVGYQSFDANKKFLRQYHFPYNKTKDILTVISSKEGSKSIIVDSYSEWKKGCYLALDAKEDLSDIPNTNVLPGKIAQINKLENGQAEIILDTELKQEVKAGTKLRIHGFGGEYIYTNNKILQPGEEEVFVSEIKKDDDVLEYSQTAFSRGVVYVKPVVLSFSVDKNETNTVLVSDYAISF